MNYKMKKYAAIIGSFIIVTALLFGCLTSKLSSMNTNSASGPVNASYYDETYRPQFHYTPEANWMNDPNGMVYLDGEYHLFYQYNPNGETWGPMHWGHAVSTDMVHWKQLPIALYPDSLGDIFSGSAVIDTNNTAGFGAGAMVAVYTSSGKSQQQSIAYSTDKGRTWTKYAGNPVIPNTVKSDFRDPKVFWNDGTKQWVMVLTAGNYVSIYTSSNLKNWKWASDFGAGQGEHIGVWECPDLFPLPVDGNAKNMKWVFTVSGQEGAPAGGTGIQYFVGDFDGTTFTNSNSASTSLWVDYGADYYAGSTWTGIPSSDGRRIMLGWMNNWKYANTIPGSTWRGSMSIPRELQLQTLPEGIRLVQKPVAELDSLRGKAITWGLMTITPGTNMLSKLSGDSYEVEAEFHVNATSASEFGFQVREGDRQYTKIGYDKTKSQLFVDRTHSGKTNFNEWFGLRHNAPLTPDANGNVKIGFYVDRQSVEVFGNDGQVSISDLIFPDRDKLGLELYAVDSNVTLNSLKFYPIQKVWGKTSVASNLQGWRTIDNGKWADTIAGKQGRSEGNSFILSSKSGKNFSYEADIQVLDGSEKGAGALVFRSDTDASNGYIASVDLLDQAVKLRKLSSGTITDIGSYPTSLKTDTSYHLKVVADKTNIKVYLGSTLAIDATDSTYKSGYFGLNVWKSTSILQYINVK